MSSSTTAAQKHYFCHQCDHTVVIPPSNDPPCPDCNGTLVEEFDLPNPNSPFSVSPQPTTLSTSRASSSPSSPQDIGGPGTDFESLIQQLAAKSAAKSAVESLLDVKISEERKSLEDGEHCAVCKDEFVIGDEAKQMPCRHLYHKGCILPWLELRNSCPLCRFKLPTEDEEYESRNGGGTGLPRQE